jgi:hypothetical protein
LTKAASDGFQNLIRSTQDQIAQFQFEAQSAGASKSAIGAFKKEHDLLREAQKSGIAITDQLRASVHALADAYGEASQAAAEAKLRSDINFQRQQLGRTPEEQAIAGQLRGIYGNDVEAHMNGTDAAALRLNQALGTLKDTAKSALSSFNQDLVEGRLNADSLKNAVQGIELKLLDLAENKALASLFGGSGSGGGLLGLLSLGGASSAPLSLGTIGGTGGILGGLFDTGGYTGNMSANAVAGVVHGREYVFDAESTARIGAGNLEALRRGALRGYESGGFVGAPPPRIADYGGNSGGGNAEAAALHVTVKVESDNEMFKAKVVDISAGVVARAAPKIKQASVNEALARAPAVSMSAISRFNVRNVKP